jgi:ADP-heptose:LPS heptosyltransferase
LQKILIIRFSSIGDIILTTPIIRAIKEQLNVEIHFVTKKAFQDIIAANPNISKIHVFNESIAEVIGELKKEKIDLIVDLHKNLRSYRLIRALNTKSVSFNKLNINKFLSVLLKSKQPMPKKHIVDRYFEGIKELGVVKDNKGLEYFMDESKLKLYEIKSQIPSKYVSIVLGGSYYTKQIPLNKVLEICEIVPLPIVLLGSAKEADLGKKISSLFPSISDFCGKLTFNESAYVIKHSEWVITSDTGLMHVAAAFHKKIISVWGNTIPEFGMEPYMPHKENVILEVNELSCRPCSKLGHHQCPKKHFNCMNKIDFSKIVNLNWQHP